MVSTRPWASLWTASSEQPLGPSASPRTNQSKYDQTVDAKRQAKRQDQTHLELLQYLTKYLTTMSTTTAPPTDHPWIGAVDDEFRMYSCV